MDSLLLPAFNGVLRGCGREVGDAVEVEYVEDAGGERMNPPAWDDIVEVTDERGLAGWV